MSTTAAEIPFCAVGLTWKINRKKKKSNWTTTQTKTHRNARPWAAASLLGTLNSFYLSSVHRRLNKRKFVLKKRADINFMYLCIRFGAVCAKCWALRLCSLYKYVFRHRDLPQNWADILGIFHKFAERQQASLCDIPNSVMLVKMYAGLTQCNRTYGQECLECVLIGQHYTIYLLWKPTVMDFMPRSFGTIESGPNPECDSTWFVVYKGKLMAKYFSGWCQRYSGGQQQRGGLWCAIYERIALPLFCTRVIFWVHLRNYRIAFCVCFYVPFSAHTRTDQSPSVSSSIE